MSHRAETMYQYFYVPQVVDAIADAEFATEFRKFYLEYIRVAPPVRAGVSGVSVCPPYVQVAVDWWVKAIQDPYKIGKYISPDFEKVMSHLYSKKQLERFRLALASIILKQIDITGRCDISFTHISKACRDAGMMDPIYYSGISMVVTPSMVEVKDAYTGEGRILWSEDSIGSDSKKPFYCNYCK